MEIWKDIKGFEKQYAVSNTGKVLSKKRELSCGKNPYIREAIERKIQKSTKGRSLVVLWSNGKHKQSTVHRLVAEAFIPNPDNKPEINHINGNPLDNRVENLEWCTRLENVHHAIATGLWSPNSGKKGKLKDYEVIEIRKSNSSLLELSVKYNVSVCSIYNVKAKRTWANLP